MDHFAAPEPLAPVTEPIAIPDVYATGLLRVESVGAGAFRFVFTVDQQSVAGDMEKVIVCRIILSADSAREAAREALRILGRFFMRDCIACLHKGLH